MSDIACSAGFGLALSIAPIYGASSNVPNAAAISLLPNPSGANSYFRPFMALCKGTVPTSHPATYTARSADFLVEWNDGSGNSSGTAFDLTTNVLDVTTIITRPAAAAAAGLATWFWLFSGPQRSYSADISQSIIGTVGTSGTDLIISNANIVAGLQYRITLPIKWPSSWTY
jgi:hypothetical protein